MKNFYIRNFFSKECYPLIGEIIISNKEYNIKIEALAIVHYADLLSLNMGIQKDEFIIHDFNIKDFIPDSKGYDYEIIDIAPGKKIKVKKISFDTNDYPLPKYYNFSFILKNKADKIIKELGKGTIEEEWTKTITITGKGILSGDIAFDIGTESNIKQSFYPICFEDDNNGEEYISIEVGENT